MRYIYKARNSIGALSQGVLEADTSAEAVKKILSDGLVPVEVDLEKATNIRTRFFSQSGKLRLEDLVDFLRRFSDLIQADISLARALQIVEKRTSREVLRAAIGRVLARVQDGMTLSAAIAAEPRVFPRFWPGLIRAGELSGRLKEILNRLSQLVEREMETKSRLISGAAYPFLILIVGILTVSILLIFVVPKLSAMFVELDQELPLITQILLFVSATLANIWWMFVLLGFAVGGWIKHLFSTLSGRKTCERFIFRIPFLGEFVKTDDMERLARTVGILLESGVEIVTALECGAAALKCETFKVQMVKVVDAVRQGKGMSAAFSTSPMFLEDVVNLISVGEESGRGYQGFLQWAQMCDRRLERMTKTATVLIEPALILFIGGMVGLIVMALLLPIFEMSLGKV